MLTQEEQEILDSAERDEWCSVAATNAEMDRYRAAAKATLGKYSRINIHISERDLTWL